MPLDVPGTWRGVRNRYRDAPDEVTDYFEPIPELIEYYPWEVSIAYAFSLLEKSHNRSLYAGAVKLHRANSTIAHNLVDRQHITRATFQKLFKNIFGSSVPAEMLSILKEAEKVRDKIVHGKKTTDEEKRKALIAVLEYAKELDAFINEKAGFRPFTVDTRGFTGRREALDNSTTRWLMRGLGFDGKTDEEENG